MPQCRRTLDEYGAGLHDRCGTESVALSVRPNLEMRFASWRREPISGCSRQQLKPLRNLNVAGPLKRIHSIVEVSLEEANVSLRQGAQAKEFMTWTEQGLEFPEIDHGCRV